MMIILKLISFSIIFSTCTIIGYLYGKTFSIRMENLVCLEQCIKMLETEIVYGATPLPEAFANIAKKGNKKVSHIFETIKNDLILHKREGVYESFLSIKEIFTGELLLKNEDVEILLSLGRVLGTSDRLDQQKNFILILNQIAGNIEEAKIDKNKNEKLYKSLGVIAGTGIIILLI